MDKSKILYFIIHKIHWLDRNNLKVDRLTLVGIESSLATALDVAIRNAKFKASQFNIDDEKVYAVQIHDADFAARILTPQEDNKQKQCEHTYIVYDTRELKYGGEPELFRKYVMTGADRDEPQTNMPNSHPYDDEETATTSFPDPG